MNLETALIQLYRRSQAAKDWFELQSREGDVLHQMDVNFACAL